MSDKMDLQLKKCITGKFRVSYDHLFKPHKMKNEDDSKLRYGLTMLFSKDDPTVLASMKVAYNNACVERWGVQTFKPHPKLPGKKISSWPARANPFRDGDVDKADKAEYANMIFVSARSKQKPGLVNRNKQPITEESGEFYAGCYAQAELIAFIYDEPKLGVSFTLQNVIKVGEGEPLSGKRDAAEAFKDLVVEDDGSEDAANYAGNEENGEEAEDALS